MKVKIADVLNFTDFYISVKERKMSVKTAYKLTKLATAIEVESDFYREKLQSIIQEYGMKDEDGNFVPTEDGTGIRLVEGKEMECGQAMNELQALEADLPDITFSAADFDGVEITLEEFSTIAPFIAD